MKISFRNSLLITIIQVLLMNPVFASRVDEVMAEDSVAMLDILSSQKKEINQYQSDLDNMEKHLAQSKKGQAIYVNFEKIGGTVLLVGLVIGSYKAHLPPSWRAMLGSYLTLTGVSRGMIKLNERDTKIFMNQVGILNKRLVLANEKIDKKITYYCKSAPDHELCDQ